MKDLYRYCQGDSHIKTNKPCQDCARSKSTDLYSMAIVSDGHGGERYFRSHIGSEYAVKITRDAIESFVIEMINGTNIFANKPFTTSEYELDNNRERIHNSLRWLFSSIICQWNNAIANHAFQNGLSQWELENVEQKYLDEFENKRQENDNSFEKTYGCTLMAYVQTKEFWFAFHIGDGKCVSMSLTEGKLGCSKPIPWDERCFLNKTTSLCDSQAIDGFRYCYQGDGHFPLAVFLGSDGIDDTYGDEEDLYNFYIELFKIILLKGSKAAKKELKKTLPIISKRGSKDDMSVACVYDDSFKNATLKLLVEYQIKQLDEEILQESEKMNQLNQKISSMAEKDNLTTSEEIDLKYAQKDVEKIETKLKSLNDKKLLISAENNG